MMRLNQRLLLQKQQADEEAKREVRSQLNGCQSSSSSLDQLPAISNSYQLTSTSLLSGVNCQVGVGLPSYQHQYMQQLQSQLALESAYNQQKLQQQAYQTSADRSPNDRIIDGIEVKTETKPYSHDLYGTVSTAYGSMPTELETALASISELYSADNDHFKLEDYLEISHLNVTSDNELVTQLALLPSTLPDLNKYDETTFNQPHFSLAKPQSCPASVVSADAPKTVHHGGRQKQPRPNNMNAEETQAWLKERMKKDNHNKIERRRRYNINDRIKDLEALLPPSPDISESRLNKGFVLKSSVDYIKSLRRDQDNLNQMTTRLHQVEDLNKKLWLHIRNLELLLQASGISHPLLQQTNSNHLLAEMMSLKQMQMQQEQQQSMKIKEEPPEAANLSRACSEAYEDSIVSDDPMMSLTSSPLPPQQTSPTSMLDNDEIFY